MSKQILRSEVPLEETWRLEDIFPTKEDWEKELKEVENLIGTVAVFKGRLGEGPKVLLECLEAQENLLIRLAKVAAYGSCLLYTSRCV